MVRGEPTPAKLAMAVSAHPTASFGWTSTATVQERQGITKPVRVL